jgi:hypothetical protein
MSIADPRRTVIRTGFIEIILVPNGASKYYCQRISIKISFGLRDECIPRPPA